MVSVKLLGAMVVVFMAVVAVMEDKCQQTNEAELRVYMHLHLWFP